MAKNHVLPIARTTRAASTFDGTYLAINPNGFQQSPMMVIIVNDTNQDIDISYDGIVDHDFLRTGETRVLNFQSNASPSNYQALIRQGTIIYVSATTGTGSIYLVGYYQP